MVITVFSKPLDQYDVFNGDEYEEYVTIAGTNDLTADELESIAAGREVNWQDLLTENAHIQNHELGFSGGNENHTIPGIGKLFSGKKRHARTGISTVLASFEPGSSSH